MQPGDYLIALAKRFGTSWEKLAELNSIGYPFIIHPGQVLQAAGRSKCYLNLLQPEVVQPAANPKSGKFQSSACRWCSGIDRA